MLMRNFLFKIHGRLQRVSISQFSVYMGIHTAEFPSSDEFKQLPFQNTGPISYDSYRKILTGKENYDLGMFKASNFKNHALRLIY